ncbi:AraC family transcriptional regulator [Phytoactinopolyspora halotolerans]|uniref:AraC family transcriptional regulator n=1 Tax=Phytoactinopolyspora halotolerans TaxID=1981512 RepID=A0A6L9SEX2_9ACTN|nr:helix-turn-helix transcriptional regulator [Phytoactinopolyspora halotolerans]NEE03975.1 AraC family transcriptional regulator [Phytoactinopolyspora halotolerans]
MTAEHMRSSTLWYRCDSLNAATDEIVNKLSDATGWEITDFSARHLSTTIDLRWYRVGDSIFSEVEFGGEVQMTVRPPQKTHIILTARSGVAGLQLDSEHIDVTPARAVALSDLDDAEIRLATGSRLSAIRVRADSLEKGLRDVATHSAGVPPRLERNLDVGHGRVRSWHRLWMFLLDEFDQPGILADTPREAHRLERLLLAMLLRAQPHIAAGNGTSSGSEDGFGRSVGGVDAASYPSYLRKTLQLIQEHPEWEHTIGSLAREVAVSERALQRRFRKHLGISPTAYMRNTRLDRVYESLRQASPYDVTIDQIARSWGFDNHGRFARRYRQRFNEAPSETLRRV